MGKMKYYWVKLINSVKRIFSRKRILCFGLRIALLDFGIFMMHRNGTSLYHFMVRSKDRIVQRYLYKNYSGIIETIKTDQCQ